MKVKNKGKSRRIYLASDSKARRKLLEIFGLHFSVISSGAAELSARKGESLSSLVKKNARAKTLAAAKKVGSGVIIAADTVVSDGKRVWGKPKNMAGARRMLKTLSGKKQWIYTGVCVLDKDTGKMKVESEKTLIYMDKLNDRQISEYFSEVCPLDKAGSFDIQGKGAFFIRRIEGCFYNVVGLPLRRLYRMLAGMKIPVFKMLLACICFSGVSVLTCGCATEYNVVTNQQERYYYSTDKEISIGQSLSRQIEKEYKLVEDPLLQKRVRDIGSRIVAVSDRRDIDYSFKVIDDPEVNAVSLPGGFVYVNKGLIDLVTSDDQLAAVIAHEVGHIVARHSIKKLQALMGYQFFRLATIPVDTSGGLTTTADLAFTELLMGYSREDELLADRLGTRYARAAGYDPHGMIQFLEKMQESNRRKPLRPKSYYKTHPYVPDRVRVVKQELGEPIDFSDYINIEEKKGE